MHLQAPFCYRGPVPRGPRDTSFSRVTTPISQSSEKHINIPSVSLRNRPSSGQTLHERGVDVGSQTLLSFNRTFPLCCLFQSTGPFLYELIDQPTVLSTISRGLFFPITQSAIVP